MTTKTVFSKEEVQRIKKQWQDDDGAASVADLIQMAGQAALPPPEIQQIRKDAERYRWLRNDCLNDAFGHDVLAPVVFNTDDSFNHSDDALMGEDLDRAIDAAMEVKP